MERVRRSAAVLVLVGVVIGLTAAEVLAQGTISGQVLDRQTLRPLAGAQVSIPELGIGALASPSGRYTLTNVPPGQVTITARYIGYGSETRTAQAVGGETVEVEFRLAQQALALDEIIVTGTPGGTQRRALGNDVARVRAADLVETIAPTNVDNLLSGRSPGVNVQMSAGEVGGGNTVKIRGLGSLTLGNMPLIYVDGVRVNNQRGGTPGTRDPRQTSRLNDFNPEDIESIEVIKGPAAATLYGTEASAGVIQIITKRGASGAATIDASVRQGFNTLMDAEKKLDWFYFIDPATGVLERWHPVITERERGFPEWLQRGPVQDYQLSVSGGQDRLRYYLAANHGYQEGYVDWNHQTETSVRGNVDAVLTDNLNVNFSSNFLGSDMRSAMAPSPYSLPGSWGFSHPLRLQTRGWYAATPEQERDGIHNTTEVTRSTYSVQVNYSPIEWLQNRLVVGQDRTNEVNDLMFAALPEGAAHPVFASQALGDKTREVRRTNYVSADLSSTARFELNPRLASATSAGFQFYKSEQESDRLVGRNFAAPGLTAIDAASQTIAGGNWVENSSVGLYVQQQVEWNNRVFLTGAVRGDDNSAFGANYNAAIYPKLSAAWVMHEEPFFNVRGVSTFRLRGAWGMAGRQPSSFAAVTLYNPVPGPGGQPALVPSSLGNPDLGPEVGVEFEAGFEAGFLNDRIATTFNFYDQTTRDALILVPAASSTGFLSSQWNNIGEVHNRGVELSVDGTVFEARRAAWNAGFNLATNKNEIRDMGSLGMTGSQFRRNMVGYPINSHWQAYVVSAEWQGSPLTGRAVNAICRTADGGEKPCAASGFEDVIYTGRSGEPTWWGAVNSTVTLFQNLRLFGNIEFMGGHLRTSCGLGCSHPVMRNTYEINGDPQNGITPDPVVHFYSRSPNPAFSSSNAIALQTHPAGWARLREVSAQYSIPAHLTRRLGASRASVSLAANNLWFLWEESPTHFGRVVGDPTSGILDSQDGGGTGGNVMFYPGTSVISTFRVSF